MGVSGQRYASSEFYLWERTSGTYWTGGWPIDVMLNYDYATLEMRKKLKASSEDVNLVARN
jgi:hypothetical protein